MMSGIGQAGAGARSVPAVSPKGNGVGDGEFIHSIHHSPIIFLPTTYYYLPWDSLCLGAGGRGFWNLWIVNCELSRTMQELIGSYIMMEEYFMREMALKVGPVFLL